MDDTYQHDYRAYDKIWQRVSPELDPYPEARLAGESTETPPEAAPPAGDSADGLLQLPGAEADPCCMGSEAQNSLDVIRGFIDGEAADRQFYLRFARCVRREQAACVLRRLAAEEGSHLRRLQAVYYLITGECYRPAEPLKTPEIKGYCATLRRAYHEEACTGFNYLRAADAVADNCLQGIFQELGEDEMRHAKALVQLLSCAVG